MNLGKILFIDIETVSSHISYSELNERMQRQWQRKSKRLLESGMEMNEENAARLFTEKAAIFAEFGKIVCISFGFLHDKERRIRVKSIAYDDEVRLLREFIEVISDTQVFSALCGHNVREFDVPYICRRMLIHGIKLPSLIDIRMKKPWEMKHILDTMELWKFGDFKHYTSLELLASIFDVETPKGDIDGSQVTSVYYNDKDLERIVKYCERDVVATINVYLKLNCLKTVDMSDVEFVERDVD